jgi:ABC-2 type transport system ATP-binding protein
VLFLDEPTIGLDPIARKAVWSHIERLRAENGTTLLLTTHYMEEADHLCDRVAILHLGKVAALGSPAELKASVNAGAATLDDVFAFYAGANLETGGTYRETFRTRRKARRLG